MTRTEKTLTEAREIAYRADPEASPELVIEVFRSLSAEYEEKRYAEPAHAEVMH